MKMKKIRRTFIARIFVSKDEFAKVWTRGLKTSGISGLPGMVKRIGFDYC